MTGAPERLLDAVLKRPHDRKLRQVWVDALLEAGDPRGELASLEGVKGSEAERRRKELVEKHRKAWLGPLAEVLLLKEGVEFEGGLLTAACFDCHSRKTIASVTGRPDWSTLRRLYFRNYTGHALQPAGERLPHPAIELLGHPVMRSLREVIGVGSHDVLAGLAARRKLPWTSVWLVLNGEPAIDALDHLAALPMLVRLGLDAPSEEALEPLLWHSALRSLEQLCLRVHHVDVWAARAAKLTPLQSLELRTGFVLENGETAAHSVHTRWTFTRETRTGAWKALTLRPIAPRSVDNILERVRSLARLGLERVTVLPPDGLDHGPLEKALATLKVPVQWMPAVRS